MLQRVPQLQKRAYLARFLLSIEIPQQFLFDSAVGDVYRQYKELQAEFRETHKTVDRLRNNTLAPNELKREIGQLEEERTQLKDKISSLQRKTDAQAGFADLLAVTSALRREQEEETKLHERMQDQMANLRACERRYGEASRRLMELRAASGDGGPGGGGGPSAEELLARLETEVRENRELCTRRLPGEIATRKAKLGSMQELLMEPAKTESDVRAMQDEVRSAQRHIAGLEAQISEAQRKQGDDKLAIFRQQSALISKKLQQKMGQLEALQEEGKVARSAVEETEGKLRTMAGPRHMGRQEFKNYANQLRQKTTHYKRLKQELADIRAETVVLHRTEAILKSRSENLQEFLSGLEAQKGISGYQDTQTELEKVSAATAGINQAKGRTLEEISKIVTDINSRLKERKNKLAPQIKELRAVRQTYQEVENE